MALFEFEEGRLIPAQFGRPVEHALDPEILESVRSQVLEVISRPLFPVTWEDAPEAGAEQGEPRLTALDPTGQIVTVEVVEVLSSATLISSLGRMGRVSRLGWLDLAASYPGGPDAFRSAWAEFRESMPTTGESGPSLVIVAAKIDDSVRTVVDVLAASGLEVQEITVREMSNGRKFLDVRPVGGRTFGAGNVLPSVEEPAAIGGSTSPVPDAEDEVAPPPEPVATETAEEVPSMEVPANDAVQTPAEGVSPVASAGEEEGAPEYLEPVEDADEFEQTEAEQDTEATPQSDELQDTAIAEEIPASVEIGEPGEQGEDPEVSAVVSETEEVTDTQEPDRLEDFEQPASESEAGQLLQHNAQGLETLGAVLDQDTILLCPRPDLGTAEAVLTAQGAIRCADAALTQDVAESLARSGIEVIADGWDQWHIGLADGPTLAEAISEVNQELTRREDRRD